MTAYASGAGDWSPLAAADPVPGDPLAVRGEADHLRRLAVGLRDQAGELRAIAGADRLRGRYATALRDRAADLELRLRQTAERCERVRDPLADWAGELDAFQAESRHLLHRARALPPDDAESLRLLRVSLARLVETRDHRAERCARRIRDACDDVLTDSRWERLADRIDAVLDTAWCGEVFEVAGWVTTVVGVTALFLTPAGWAVDGALALGAAVAAKDGLALATGEGSWFDVGMDTVGLLTMGAGKAAFASLDGIRVATRGVAGVAAEERAVEESVRTSRPALDRTYRVTGRRASSGASRAEARRVRAGLRAEAARAGSLARAEEESRALPPATAREALAFGGDREVAGVCKDIERMRTEYPNDEAVHEVSEGTELWTGVFNASWRTGMATDVADKTFGSSDVAPMKPHLQEYDDFKDRFKTEIGTGW